MLLSVARNTRKVSAYLIPWCDVFYQPTRTTSRVKELCSDRNLLDSMNNIFSSIWNKWGYALSITAGCFRKGHRSTKHMFLTPNMMNYTGSAVTTCRRVLRYVLMRTLISAWSILCNVLWNIPLFHRDSVCWHNSKT